MCLVGCWDGARDAASDLPCCADCGGGAVPGGGHGDGGVVGAGVVEGGWGEEFYV